MRLVGIGGPSMGGDGDGSVVARGEGGDGVARGGGGPLPLHALSGGQTWGHRVGLQIHWLPEMSIISFWSSVPKVSIEFDLDCLNSLSNYRLMSKILEMSKAA